MQRRKKKRKCISINMKVSDLINRYKGEVIERLIAKISVDDDLSTEEGYVKVSSSYFNF